MNLKRLEPADDRSSAAACIRIICRECNKVETWNYAAGSGWVADCDLPSGACYICNECLDAYRASGGED